MQEQKKMKFLVGVDYDKRKRTMEWLRREI